MMKKVTLLLLLCCAFMLPAFAQFSNVPVTGFNADIVADGAVGAGSFSTNASADVAIPPYVFVSQTFNPGSAVCANNATALPPSNTITSTNTTNNTGITYTLQSYGNGTATNNNVLQMLYNATATFTLTTPIAAARLYLVCLGGSGAVTFTAQVNFTDATNQIITNSPAAPDWCGGAALYKLTSQQYYRINNNATTCSGAGCQYLYEIPVTISPANYGKTIGSVTFTNTTTGTVFSIFAMGAQAPCATPAAQPTALVTTPGLNQATGSFTAATGSPTGYLVVRYPVGAAVTDPANTTTYTAGQALGLGTVVSAGTTTSFTSTGLTTGTTYTHYIYSYNSGTTCAGPIYRLTTPLTGNVTTNSCGTLTGIVPVGPGLPNTPAGGFTSLTNAMTYITNNGIAGNTTLALQTGYDGTSANETFPITFPLNPCIGAAKTLTIRPATGVTGLSITNSSDGAPVIDFSGATYVTIDGVNNGLTISNTNASANANTATIRFINDATKCTVTNCTVLGSSTGSLSTNNGTIYFATGVTNGNDSITISNCKIGPAGTNLPSKGIYAQGSTATALIANSVILVNNNEIYDFFLTGGCSGLHALTGNTDWTITNNKIYQTATRTFTASGTMTGINFVNTGFAQNVQINSNTIGYANNAGTGTLTLDGSTIAGAFAGISFAGLSSGTIASNINSNTIAGISLTSSSGVFNGIVNTSGAGGNTLNINNNIINNIATITTTGDVRGISWGAATNIVITGNTVSNISRTGTGNLYGINSNSTSSVNETVSNNIVSNLSAPSTAASTINGIFQSTTTGTKIFQTNQVFNLSGAIGSIVNGIRVTAGTTVDISGNTIYALSSTGGTAGTVMGINFGAGTLYNIYKNKIYNLSMTSTGGVTSGIFNNGSTGNVYNNLIGDLSSTAYTSTSSPYMGVAGINISSGTSNVYNNTIRIGAVTSSGTNFSAMGIYASTSPTVLLQNNLVVNLATPVGSGKAVGYQRSGTTLTSYATASGSNSFYTGTPGAANVMFWDGTNAYQDLASFRTAMAPRDQYSFNDNPSFVSTAGTAATYLHITPAQSTVLESAGITVALFNTDFDGDARPGPVGSVSGGAVNYDIGADEFDGVPSFSCVQPAPGNTLTSANNICNGNSVTLSLQNTTPGNGITYKWYSSTDGTNFTLIAGAANATYATVPTAPTYYRAVVTCGTTLSATSTAVLVTFASNVTSTTPAQRCGTGSVSLAATASSGTLRWYNAVTGGLSIATGSPYVTPIISATTTYYVGAETPVAGSATFGTGTSSTGTTSYPNPLSAYYGGTKHQLLFLASELAAQGLSAGNITSVSFDLAAVTTSGICNDFTIRMGQTSSTALTGFEPGTVNAYNATYTPTASGIVTFTLTTPFNWNGTSNLVLETVHNQGNGGNGSGTTHRYTTTPFNSVYVRYADNVSPGTAAGFDATTLGSVAAYANRPNVIFGGQVICSGPRQAVVATINTAPTFTVTPNQTICNNAVTPLTVTSTVGNYNSYIWTPATNLYTNAAGTTAYVAGSSASTVYVKSSVVGDLAYTVNASNSTTLCAAVTNTTVSVLPGAVTAIATPGSICVSGTTTLALTPATGYGAATFQWQSSSNNSTFVDVNTATNPTYTTPVTTVSTYYRATIKNSAGAVCLNSVSDTARVYNPIITSTTPASRCGPGTLNLSATSSEGVINWFAAATGGAPLSTGSTFTTPSIAATTTYYASAASGGTSGTATLGAGALTSVSGTPDFTGISPYAYHYGNYKHQMLITAAELTALGISAGDITSLAFDVANAGSPVAAFNNFSITLIATSASALTSTFETGGISVFAAASVTPTLGINTYPFTAVFPWNGTSNIVVQTCYNNNNSGVVASSAEVKYDNTTFVSQNIYRVDGTQPTVCAQTTGNASNDGPIISKRPKMLIGYNGSCESPRIAVAATVNPLPTPTISPAGPVNICAGGTTTLTGGGGGTYQWRNAAGNIGGATNSIYTTGNAGTYRVIVTTTATGCKDTSVAVTVNVNPLPVVNLGNDTTFCSGNTLTLNAGNTGSTFLWNNATTAQTRAVTTTGTYWVRVTNANTCQKTDTILVTVNPTPVVNLGNDTNLCQGVNFVLNSGNPTATRLWDNGTTAQTRTVTNTGTYYVRVTNSFNCTARDTIVTTFLPSPTVNLGADINACVGATVTLDAGNPGETYLWDNASTLQTRNVTGTGNYFVTVKNIANCKGSDTVKVTFHTLPVVNLGNDTAFCYGNTLTLNAANPGSSYIWNTNATTQTIDVNSTGNYAVTVTDQYQCVGSDNINILVKDPPTGTINAVHGNPATYTFNVLNQHYVTGIVWNFGDGSPLVSGNMVQHTYLNNGIYIVNAHLLGECADTTLNTRTVDVYDGAGGTGINQLDNNKELVLYPNPARDLVVIENKKNFRMQQVTLYSVVGQMLSTSVADSPDKHQLNTSGLASGVYTLRIETDKGTVIRKFEIMK